MPGLNIPLGTTMPFGLSNTASELLLLSWHRRRLCFRSNLFVWIGFLSIIENSFDFLGPYNLVTTDDDDGGGSGGGGGGGGCGGGGGECPTDTLPTCLKLGPRVLAFM